MLADTQPARPADSEPGSRPDVQLDVPWIMTQGTVGF
jgi:hypothetical protein